MKTKLLSKLVLLITIIFTLACSTLIAPATPSDLEILQTARAAVEAKGTIDPDGRLHDLMKEEGVTLTAKEVQYDMANKVGQKFGLSGKAEICDYYNWGYDESIEDDYFCMEVTPDGGYLEKWYIYVNRESGLKLYNDLLSGKTTLVFLIAMIDLELYDENQENMARSTHIQWNSW